MHLGYCFLLFIVSCVGMVRYRRYSIAFKILTWSVIGIFLTTLVDRYFIVKYKFNGPVLQIQCIEEYIFYSLVYYHLFKNETIKKFIIILIILMVLFFPFNAIFLQPFFHRFPTNINISAQILNASFALFLFKEMLDYPVKVNIIKQSIFWFNLAMLFYSTTIFFMMGLSNYLVEHSVESNLEDKIVGYLWYFIDYSFHIFICIALLTHNKEDSVTKT